MIVVVAILLVGVVGFVVVSFLKFRSEQDGDVDRLLTQSDQTPGKIVTPEMIAALPEPARRYFAFSQIVGKPIPRIVRLTQKGRIRTVKDGAWIDLEADEIYSTSPPAFVWRASFPRQILPLMVGRDEYLEGGGSIVMKLGGTVTVAEERGAEMGPAGLMRYLNEMMWFPAAYLGDNVAIEPVDDASFRVTITDRGQSASATLFVGADGGLSNFRASRFSGATRRPEVWETPMVAFGTLAGVHLPIRGTAIWKLADGDFPYIELDILSVAYDSQP